MHVIRRSLGVLAAAGLFVSLAGPARAQAPPPDPFLGVSVLTTGAAAPGDPVVVTNNADKTTSVPLQPALTATNQVTGYDASVLDPIKNFTAAPFSFDVTAVNGSALLLGTQVSAHRVDENGDTIAGAGGKFTVNADGTFAFARGSDFADLDTPGDEARVAIGYSLHGANSSNLQTKNFTGTLYVVLRVQPDGSILETPMADFPDFGSSTFPQTQGKAFPDLDTFVHDLLRFEFAGNAASPLDVTNTGNLTTNGLLSGYGISATTIGARGYDGRDASITHSSTDGEPGGVGGTITLNSTGNVSTQGVGAVGIFAWSAGGDGGQGGDSGYTRNSKAGGPAGTGGEVHVTGSGTITTQRDNASGILALSQGGNGGGGGDGSTFNGAENGANGGRGGTVDVNGSWAITTHGNKAYGIWAKSFGGQAGSGGDGGWTGTSSGDGGFGTEGGTVSITHGGSIRTFGDDAYGLFGQSIGGFGGDGGSGASIFYATGGSGEKAGSGGSVTITNHGSIWTSGLRAHGIFAESVGGGGGTGGSGSALAGLGGEGAGGGDAGNVRVNNTGSITATGAGARGIYAQSVGGGGGDGGDGAGLVGIGGKGSATSDGGTVAVANAGTILSSNSAIYAQSIGGGGGDGGSAAGLISVGGDGGAGGDSNVVTVSSHGNLTTTAGDNATAVFAQSVGGGGGNGGNSIAVGVGLAAAIGGRGGVGGKGSDVKVGVDADTSAIDPVTGAIRTQGESSHGIQAQSIGGGGGNGGFAFAGSFAPGISAALALGGNGADGNISKSVSVYFGDASSSIVTSGANSNGLFAQSVGGGGGNGGLSIAAAVSSGVALGLTVGGGGGKGADAGDVTVGDDLHPLLGTIETSGEHAYGVLAQSVGGGGGNGGLSVSVAVSAKGSGALAIGGDGGAAGNGAAVNLVSDAVITTAGGNSHALFAQSVGGGGGSGGGAIGAGISGGNALELTFGGRGAGGGDAGNVTLTNGGTHVTSGEKSYGLLAQSIGGGGGDGGFAISGGISGGSNLNVGIGGGGGTASSSGLVTVTNAGSIFTSGADSHALFVQSAGGGGGSGGFSVAGGIAKSGSFSAAVGGVGGAGGNGSNVWLSNTAATFETTGDRAYGILAQSIGGGGGDGGFAVAGGISQSNSIDLGIGGKGATGGHAGTVDLFSSTAITTTGELAHGIFAQSVGGGGGSGGFAISGAVTTQNAMAVSIGGAGGNASYADRVSVTNTGAITTGGDGSGQGSYGILAQSIGGGGGAGGFSGAFTGTFGGQKKGKSLSLSIGGSGGHGGDGGIVELTNSGTIFTKANDSVGLYAQSVGGGGGNGGFSLDASLSTSADSYDIGVAIGGSGNAAGNAKTVTLVNDALVETLGDHSHGIQAQSIGGGGGNGGFAVSATGGTGKQTRSASAAVGGTAGAGGNSLDVSVTNNAAISTAGDDAMGIQAQSLGGGGGNGGFAISGTLSGDGGKSLSIALGGDGGSGGTAGKVDVLGSGGYTISTLGARSVGVQATSVGGGGGNGGFSAAVALGEGGNQPGKGSTALGISVGGDGGGGDTAGAVSVGSYVNGALVANITTAGQEAVGIQAQSLGGGGGNGGMSYAGAINAVPSDKAPNTDAVFAVGGGGGNGDNASSVLVRHVGDIFTSGDGAHGIEAQSIGGGGGNAGGAQALTLQLGPKPPVVDESKLTDAEKKQRIDDKKKTGSNKSLSVSIGGHGGGASDGSTVTVDHTGDITTLGGDAHGIFAQSIGGGGGTGGDADSGLPDINDLPLLDVLKQRLDRSKKAYSGKDVSIIVGGSGGSSGNGDAVLVKHAGVITTFGDNSHGVFAQSIGGGGGAGGSGELGVSGTVGVGGGTGSTGNGGTVDVQIAGAVNTFGGGSHAIFAQSIGGGGGQSGNVDRGLKNYANIGFGLAFGQGGGNGGDGRAVTVTSTANLTTYGVGSNGIFAQSIGGGGGVAGDLGNDLPFLSMTSFAGSVGGTGSADVVHVTQTGHITTFGDASDGVFAQSAGGQQTGKAVTVTLNSGDIVTAGAESNGIFAQSTGQGGRDDITVTIANADSVVMGGSHTGAAVRFADGATNLLSNHGTMRTVDGLSGTAVVGTGGNETIRNFGTTVGSIDLGAGTNAFSNESPGLFITGEHVTLGGTSTLINAGTLSSGDWGHVQTTTVDGRMTQTGTPTWLVDLGAGGTSDRLAMTGGAQFGSSVTRLDLNPLSMPTASSSFTLATAASGLGSATFKFGTYYGDLPIGQTFDTVASDRDVRLTVTPSTGLFRWTGLTGSSWTTPFVDGVSNWASDASGQTFVYGTPGVATDVLVGQRSGVSFLGGDFAVNSLHFDDVTLGAGLGDTMIGGGALTIEAKDGTGLTIDRGVAPTTLDVGLTLGNSQTWTNDGALLAIVAGSISGSGRDLTITGVGQTYVDASIDTGRGSLTKDGDGILVLGGRNSYSGGTFVKNGMLVGSARSLQGTIANDATVMFDQPDAGEYAGVMSGTGLLAKQGVGTLTLSGANTYSGGTYLAAGALQGTTTSLQGDILNLGSLIFDQPGTGTYAGSLAGTGSLLLRGGGSYVFSGNSGGFAGQTTVSGSKLSVNGWLGGGTVFVQSGSTVGGVGIIPTVRVQSGGTLAPGNSIGTLSIDGSATFETGSHYQIETEAYGSSDAMVVMGSVFGAGGTVDVHAGGTRRYRPINRYTIAQVGGSVIPFAGATSDLAYLVPSLQYEPHRVLLTLRRTDVDFRTAGTQGNETPVAEVFNALVATATGSMADSINSVYDLADPDIRHAFGTMGGIIYQHAARSGLATAQTFTALGMKRLDMTSGDAASGDVGAGLSRDNLHLAGAAASFVRSDDTAAARHGFWLSGLGGVAQYAGSAGSASARTRLLGFAAGLDVEPVHGLTLGVVGGRATPEIHLDGANDRADSAATQAGGYGRVAFGASRVDAAASFGRSRNEVWRAVTDGTILPTAHASFDGAAMSSQLDYAYGMKLGRRVLVEPQVGYHYGRLSLEGTTETGADVLDLLVPDRLVTSNQVTAGARVVTALGGEVTKWTLEGRAAWQRELTGLPSMRLRFTGDMTTDGFLLAAPSLRRNGANVGVSIVGARAKGLRLGLDIDGQIGGPIAGWNSNISVDKRW